MKITIHIDGRHPHIIYNDEGDACVQVDVDDVPVVGLTASEGRLTVGIWPDGEAWEPVPGATPQWEQEFSPGAVTCDVTHIGALKVEVCEDDEGPLRPAYYWVVSGITGSKLIDGWESSPVNSRREAVKAARLIASKGSR